LTLPVDRFIEAIESFDPRQTDRLLAGIEPHDISKTQWQTIVDLLTRVLALRSDNEALESAPAQQALVADLISAFVAGAADSSERSKAPGRPRKSRSRIRARVSEYLQSVGGACCGSSMVYTSTCSERRRIGGYRALRPAMASGTGTGSRIVIAPYTASCPPKRWPNPARSPIEQTPGQ
jgi:hypothetical protein